MTFNRHVKIHLFQLSFPCIWKWHDIGEPFSFGYFEEKFQIPWKMDRRNDTWTNLPLFMVELRLLSSSKISSEAQKSWKYCWNIFCSFIPPKLIFAKRKMASIFRPNYSVFSFWSTRTHSCNRPKFSNSIFSLTMIGEFKLVLVFYTRYFLCQFLLFLFRMWFNAFDICSWCLSRVEMMTRMWWEYSYFAVHLFLLEIYSHWYHSLMPLMITSYRPNQHYTIKATEKKSFTCVCNQKKVLSWIGIIHYSTNLVKRRSNHSKLFYAIIIISWSVSLLHFKKLGSLISGGART